MTFSLFSVLLFFLFQLDSMLNIEYNKRKINTTKILSYKFLHKINLGDIIYLINFIFLSINIVI